MSWTVKPIDQHRNVEVCVCLACYNTSTITWYMVCWKLVAEVYICTYIFFFYNRNRYSIETKMGTFLDLYSVTLHCLFCMSSPVQFTPVQSTILKLCPHQNLDFIIWQQDRQCTYNVTLRYVCATMVFVDNGVSTTYSEWVLVPLGIQHAEHMCHIVICGLPFCTVIFYIVS